MQSTWRVCSTSGCGELAPKGGKCPECRRVAELRRGTAAQRGYDAKWRETRRRKLSAVGICEFPRCNEPATDVHHLVGGPLDPTGHQLDFLKSYCHAHHSVITGSEYGFRR